MFHYLFQVLVYQFRVLTVEYFMDQCTEWELNDLIDNIPFLDRNQWEIGRLQAWITAQTSSTKKLSFQDICTFKWEQKSDIPEDIQHDQEITNEEINRLKTLAKRWEN